MAKAFTDLKFYEISILTAHLFYDKNNDLNNIIPIWLRSFLLHVNTNQWGQKWLGTFSSNLESVYSKHFNAKRMAIWLNDMVEKYYTLSWKHHVGVERPF